MRVELRELKEDECFAKNFIGIQAENASMNKNAIANSMAMVKRLGLRGKRLQPKIKVESNTENI